MKSELKEKLALYLLDFKNEDVSLKDSIERIVKLVNKLKSESNIKDEEIKDRCTELATYYLRRKKEIAIEFNNDYLNPPAYTNKASVKAVAARLRPIMYKQKVTEKDIDMILSWVIKTWGFDPNMRDYIRPSTILGSVNKWVKYKENATLYWRNQSNVSTKVY